LDRRILRILGTALDVTGRGVGHPIGIAIQLNSNPSVARTYSEKDVAQSLKRLAEARAVTIGSYGDTTVTPAGAALYRAEHEDDAEPSQHDSAERVTGPSQRNRFEMAVSAVEDAFAGVDPSELAALDASLAIDPKMHAMLQDFRVFTHTFGGFTTSQADRVRDALGETWSPTNGGWADSTTLVEKFAVMSLAEQAGVPGTTP
jgi:hypothetical protein